MATVGDILAVKGSHVLSIGPEATVLDAAMLMNEHKVGSLLVMSGGQLIGIITERDILLRSRRAPARPGSHAGSGCDDNGGGLLPTRHEPGGSSRRLKNRRIRHLPVVDEATRLCGVVSIGDLNAHETHVREHTIHVLQEYIYGRV